MRYYIADNHFLHAKLNEKMDVRGFKDVEEMDNYMISQWNSVVRKNDEIVILGDLIWTKNGKIANDIIKQLHGKKYMIIGNHDAYLDDKNFNKSLFASIDQYRVFNDDGRKVVCCHYPLLCYEGQYRLDENGNPKFYMLYGHVHNTADEKYIQDCIAIGRERMLDVHHDGTKVQLPYELYNCFSMFSDYKPLTLNQWIEYHHQKTNI